MVLTQEARKQLEQQRKLLAQRQQQIRETRLRGLTASEKRQQTQQSLSKRRVAGRSVEQQKQQQLERLKPVEEELKKTEQEIARVEAENKAIAQRNAEIARQQRDFTIVKKFVDKNIPIPVGSLTKSQKELLNELRAGKDIQFQRIELTKEIQPKGLTFLDLKKQQETITTTELGPKQLDVKTQQVRVQDITKPGGVFGSSGFVVSNLDKLKPLQGSVGRLIRGEPFLKTQEQIAEETAKAELEASRLKPEDVYSFKELAEKGEGPAIVRKASGFVGEKIFGVSTQITGQEPTPEEKVKGGKLVGESLLFTGLLAPFPTTAQVYKQLSTPAQVKILGIEQAKKGQKVETNIVFETTKPGTREIGRAKGVALTKRVPGTERLVTTKSTVVGASGKRALFPSGKVRLADKKAFIGYEKGIGIASKKQLVKVGTGKVAVKGEKVAEVVKFQSATLQQTGAKGRITQIAGGVYTPDKVPIAGVKGLLFKGKPIEKFAFDVLKSPTSKKGAVSLFKPLGTAQNFVPSITQQAGLSSTLSVAGGFGSTLGVIPTSFVSGGLLAGSKLAVDSKLKEKQIVREIKVTKQEPRVSIGPFIEQAPKIVQEERLKIVPKEEVTIKQVTTPAQVPQLRQQPKQQSISRTKQLLKQTPIIVAPPVVKTEDEVKSIPPKPVRGAYDVYIKRRVRVDNKKTRRAVFRERFVKFKDDLPKNLAIRTGARYVAKHLPATFKIKFDPRGKVKKKDIPTYTPNPKMFRDFQIRRGQRVPMKNKWIEKRPFRLDTPAEKRELMFWKRQQAKYKKRKRK